MLYFFNTGMDTDSVKEFMASGTLWMQFFDCSIPQVVIIWNDEQYEFLIFSMKAVPCF